MANDEVSGTVELNRWCPLPDGTEVLLEPTSKARRFRIRKRPRENRASKVRVRHLGRNKLTAPNQSDTDSKSGVEKPGISSGS